METLIKSVGPYKYFWFHTNIQKEAAASDTPLPWNRKKNDESWIDGDHYIGALQDYCFGTDNDVLVVLDPLLRVESDDSNLKWHKVDCNIKLPAIMHFRDCILTSAIGKSRIRYKSGNDQFLLSCDDSDSIIFDVLTGVLEVDDL
jgi:hypothetical protein